MSNRPASEMAGLTGLRGIAAITVFIAHGRFYEMVPSLRPFLIFFEWHSLAVDLFFMLSGFVLVHVYSARFDAGVDRFWGPYFMARIARVVPLYLATLAACLGIFGAGSLVLGKWPAHVTWDVVATNLALLQNWPGLFHISLNIPSWSLSVEVFCYILVMPVALLMHRLLRRGSTILILIALLLAWRAVVPSIDSNWIGLLRGITGFLAGALLHKLHLANNDRIVIATTLTSAALFLILQSLVAWGGYASFLPVITFPFLIHGLGSSARSIVHDFFRSPIMLWLGDISYSTYLWHGPVYLGAHAVVRPKLMSMPAYVRVIWIIFEFTLILWISHLSYYRFELPLRRRLR